VIAVIDYGAGNLRSALNAFEALNHKPIVINNPVDLVKVSTIVFL